MFEIAALLSLIGTFFLLVGALGLVRMPDLFLRMSAATKAATLGIGLTLLGAALVFDDAGVRGRALATAAFLLVTAPVAAQVIGRAAYRTGYRPWGGTVVDELTASGSAARVPPAPRGGGPGPHRRLG